MKKISQKGFTQIPNNLVRDSDISNDAHRVLLVILSHDQTKFDIDRTLLYRQAGNISTFRGRNAIAELEEKGFLTITKIRFKDTYHYKFEASVSSRLETEAPVLSRLETDALKKTILKNNIEIEEDKVASSAYKKPVEALSSKKANGEEQPLTEAIKQKPTKSDDMNLNKLKEPTQANRHAFDILQEVIGFDPIDRPEDAIKALQSLKEQSNSKVFVTPLSKRSYNVDVLISIVHKAIEL